MADIKIKRVYPCGYVEEIDSKATGMFEKTPDIRNSDGCPIHGKDCKGK